MRKSTVIPETLRAWTETFKKKGEIWTRSRASNYQKYFIFFLLGLNDYYYVDGIGSTNEKENETR
jgi:hypothetical protein